VQFETRIQVTRFLRPADLDTPGIRVSGIPYYHMGKIVGLAEMQYRVWQIDMQRWSEWTPVNVDFD